LQILPMVCGKLLYIFVVCIVVMAHHVAHMYWIEACVHAGCIESCDVSIEILNIHLSDTQRSWYPSGPFDVCVVRGVLTAIFYCII
jgi:hypothetical protein